MGTAVCMGELAGFEVLTLGRAADQRGRRLQGRSIEAPAVQQAPGAGSSLGLRPRCTNSHKRVPNNSVAYLRAANIGSGIAAGHFSCRRCLPPLPPAQCPAARLAPRPARAMRPLMLAPSSAGVGRAVCPRR